MESTDDPIQEPQQEEGETQDEALMEQIDGIIDRLLSVKG
jgi:hypothetical protein